jgi:hypothetical protein
LIYRGDLKSMMGRLQALSGAKEKLDIARVAADDAALADLRLGEAARDAFARAERRPRLSTPTKRRSASPSAVRCQRHHLEGGETGRGDCRRGPEGVGEAQQTQAASDCALAEAQGDRVATQRERAAMKAQGEEAERRGRNTRPRSTSCRRPSRRSTTLRRRWILGPRHWTWFSAMLDRRADALDRFVKRARPN